MADTKRVDLNSDMGEGFGKYTMGDDDAILKVVTSANVACGFHAGDPDTMARVFRLAKDRGVAIGAHPGFFDLWGFGRRQIPHTPDQVERLVAYQIGAAQGMAALAGHKITFVKAHGALGNMTEVDADLARAVARAIRAVDPSLTMMAIALSEQVRAAEAEGLAHAAEVFADRAYTEKGTLVSRALPGAVIHDPEEAAARVLRMVESGGIETVSGKFLKTPVDSICVHSDTPTAVALAGQVRKRLEAAGIDVRPFT